MSKMLSREDLLKRRALKVEKVELEEGYVYVKEMTAADRDRFEKMLYDEVDEGEGKVEIKRNTENFRGKLAVMTVCDEKGNLLLSPEDFKAFSESISAKEMEKIIDKALSLNRMSKEEVEAQVKN